MVVALQVGDRHRICPLDFCSVPLVGCEDILVPAPLPRVLQSGYRARHEKLQT